MKTDQRDAALIARCLAHRDYSPVHIPSEQDEQVKEFLRMRQDHKLALKKVKQQILLSACGTTFGMRRLKPLDTGTFTMAPVTEAREVSTRRF